MSRAHRAARAALELLVVAGLITGCGAGGSASTGDDTAAALPPARSAVPVPGGLNQRVQVTFYAAADNDPAGSTDIAYANSRHAAAGGTGTFTDPLTLASDPGELRPGTVVYYPRSRSTSSWRTTAPRASMNGPPTAPPTSTCGCPPPPTHGCKPAKPR